MPWVAKELGTSTVELANMTDIEQLVYVEKYFEKPLKYYKLNTLNRLYMAVFSADFINYADDPGKILYAAGTVTARQNSGKNNVDITSGWVTRAIRGAYSAAKGRRIKVNTDEIV
jgi:hypothetical protein